MALLEKYGWLTACTGLEANILPDNSFHFRYCSVSVNKNQLEIGKKGEAGGKLQEVLKKVPRDIPVALTISGKGVLIKKLPDTESTDGDALGRVFPNLDRELFYVQYFVSGNSLYIAIIRKETTDRLLDSLANQGIKILSLSLGPFAATHILSQFNTYSNEISFDGHYICYSTDHTWAEYRYTEGLSSQFTLKIGKDPIEEQYVLAYASAFQLALYKRLNPVVTETSPVTLQLKDFEEEKKFRLRAAISLVTFFILLLFNFMLFSYYNDANQVLQTQISRSTATTENIDKMQQEISRKEKQLKDLGWNRGISYAWLCDQVGQTVPASVQLNSLSIDPLNQAESNSRRREVYDTGWIRITGSTAKMGDLNNWVYILKEKPWTREVKIDSYGPSQEDNIQEFSLSLRY